MKKSKTSFKLKDVKGIAFGGISSRFWMYRKHMMTMDIEEFVQERV